MTLKQLEEGLQYLREQGADDNTEMVVYDDFQGWMTVDNFQYCTYDPEEDDEEFNPTIVLYTE